MERFDRLGFHEAMSGKEMLGINIRDDKLINLLANNKEEIVQLWKLQCGGDIGTLNKKNSKRTGADKRHDKILED